MSEDFDPSPRVLKRRKVGTYGASRPTLPAENSPTASIWDNVSTSVSGLSRRLFASGEPGETTQPKDPIYASHEKGSEIAEGDNEVAVGKATPSSASRGRKTGASPNGAPAKVNSTKNARQDSSQTKRSTEPASEDADGDIITVQPRSSGRERKRNRRYSIEPEEVGLKHKNDTKSSAKSAGSTRMPSVTKPTKKPMVSVLTPSKRNEKKARKSVVFEDSEKQIEQDFGFKDISGATKNFVSPTTWHQRTNSPSKSSTESKQQLQADDVLAEPEPEALEELLLEITSIPVPILEEPSALREISELAQDTAELQGIKRTILARFTGRASNAERPPTPPHLSSAYETLYTLLQTTVSSGESNSLLLLGSRGTGKSLLVNTALENLRTSSSTDFHTIRLNGFVQTDDRLALREIWRQLGREMEVDEDETNQVVGSYADTVTSLLGLLSQPEGVPDIGAVEYAAEKIVTKSVVFVLDEFDLFTTHPRQTLLYNLFDIAQSRKAPIAVIGCSARTDCVECLEKRVKSRFSHRWLHVGPPQSLAAFQELARDNLLVSEKRVGMMEQELEWAVDWNEYIKSAFLPSPAVQSLISSTFYTTRSLSDLFAALYTLVATASISDAPIATPLLSEPPSLLSLLPFLPHIHLSLLVCATRLEAIHSLTQLNFNIVYAHYTDLLTKSKLSASVSGAVASGLRGWGRNVCLMAWEELVRWRMLVKVGGKDERLGEDGRMYRIDVSIEEVRWAVEKIGTGVGEGLGRWCREI